MDDDDTGKDHVVGWRLNNFDSYRDEDRLEDHGTVNADHRQDCAVDDGYTKEG